ncbi:MAG: hypothetical protein ABR577_00665 [Pyrinomonadaceae bacterium]
MGNSDPILNLLKDFSYNVVRLPRTGIRPLQILEKQGNDLVVLGDVADLFIAGSSPLPAVGPDEQAAFINGKRTRSLSISVGLSLLGGIIGAMTGSKVKLDVVYKKASALAFEFNDVQVNQTNQIQLSKFLTAARIDETVGPPAKLLEADKLYVITGTIKSRKFTAEAARDGGVSAEVDVPLIKSIVSGSVGVTTEGANNSKISYEGTVPLVFGFQAIRMEFEQGKFKGFKQVDATSVALRDVGTKSGKTEPEMLKTESPFVNFFNSLPDNDTNGGANKGMKESAGTSGGAVKQAAKKSGAKKAVAKKAGAKKGGGKSGTAKSGAKSKRS